MPDGIYIWAPPLLLLLVFVAALGFGRWIRPVASDDLRTRYVKLRAVCFGVFFFEMLQARRKMREQPNFSRQKIKRPTPAFFWQAVLILLPVALMAGFGFWALLRERNAVEHEAQQRAKEIFQRLPGEFDQIAANRLTQMDGSKDSWYRYLEDIAAWPDNKSRKQRLADTNELQILTRELAAFRSAFPDWQGGPVPLVDFQLNTNGDLWFGHPIPPRPPAWLTTLSAEQQQTWVALQTAACAGRSLSNLLESFRQTQPPAPAFAYAEFLQLRAGLSSLAATNAVNQLLQFAGRHFNHISDSGVPLRTLVLAEALKLARDGGLNEPLWEKLQSEVTSPSALTPVLLDEAGRLVASNTELSEAIKAMRILLADKLAQAEMAEVVQQSGKLNAITTTNLWLNTMGRRWFCVLSPTESRSGIIVSNHPVWITYTNMTVRCYPKFLVARGFVDALADAKISLPDYFGLALEVEGENISLPAPWNKPGDGKPAGDILAEEQFQMRQPAILLQQDPVSGRREEIPFEAMPGHPKFSMQIRLTDRNLLFARQHQLQFVFGALIAASAVAAFIGFLAAHRAFRRELQLNEMKSNFVSSVSHELRAPIASVRLMAENLEHGKISELAKQNEYFHFIGQECRRLSSLIENVLDFSRIEQGRKQYEFEPTDVVALVETTLKLMEPYALEKSVRLEIKSETQILKSEMDLDGRAIQQALVNLIDNAIKHSAKGETVTVGLEIKNGKLKMKKSRDRPAFNAQLSTLHLSVSDRGPGIPAAEHEKIFERFYRLGSELRRETPGVGIGLSIVKHIVEAHGGHVVVQSASGQGSRFTIELPVSKSETRILKSE